MFLVSFETCSADRGDKNLEQNAPENGRQCTEFSQNRNKGAYWVFRCCRELPAPMKTAKPVSELAAVSEIVFSCERHSTALHTIKRTRFERF